MKTISAIIILLSLTLFLFFDTAKPDAAILVKTDIDFCKLCQEAGMHKSFIQYADDSVIKPAEGRYAIWGKEALKKSYEGKDDTKFKLLWKPVKAEISAAGDIGFTFGNWKLTSKTEAGIDTTEYGNYVTIWKKQKDGSFKFVLDTGNDTPEPKGGF